MEGDSEQPTALTAPPHGGDPAFPQPPASRDVHPRGISARPGSPPHPDPLPQPRATNMSFRLVSHYKAGKPRLAALKGKGEKRDESAAGGAGAAHCPAGPAAAPGPPGTPFPGSRLLPSLARRRCRSRPLPARRPPVSSVPPGPPGPPRSPGLSGRWRSRCGCGAGRIWCSSER